MRLSLLILVLLIATIAGIYVRSDPGYALFAYQDWTIEMPLWLACVFLILTLALSVFILWFLSMLFSSTGRIKEWWQDRKRKKAGLYTNRGLLELAEGRWKQAERLLSRGAQWSDAPLVNYLSAAKAAEEAGASDRRDKYLELAYNASHGSDIAVRLTEAQLRYKHGELEQSIATLQHLHAEQPKHPQVLKLLSTIYEATQDWQSLFHLFPALKRASVFPNKEAEQRLERKIYQALMPVMAKEGKNPFIKFWNSASKEVQTDPVCLSIFCQLLVKQDSAREAEALLRSSLAKTWAPDLIRLYGELKGPSPKKQLDFVEKTLLPQQPEDAILLLTLGRLCLRNQLWGKARDYLEKSVSKLPTTEGYALLGRLMEQLGLPDKQNEYFKKGLNCVTPVMKSDWPLKSY